MINQIYKLAIFTSIAYQSWRSFLKSLEKQKEPLIKQAESHLIILPKPSFEYDYKLDVPTITNIANNNILTQRETQCLRVLNEGKSYKEISSNLNISTRTVENHINNIKQKTGLNSRSQLIQFYQEEIW